MLEDGWSTVTWHRLLVGDLTIDGVHLHWDDDDDDADADADADAGKK